MARKIICALPNKDKAESDTCIGVVAHQISPRMLQIGRQDGQRISIIAGEGNSNVTATCPRCKRVHTFIIKAGTINEEGHTYEELKAGDPNDDNGGVEPPDDAVTPPAPEE